MIVQVMVFYTNVIELVFFSNYYIAFSRTCFSQGNFVGKDNNVIEFSKSVAIVMCKSKAVSWNERLWAFIRSRAMDLVVLQHAPELRWYLLSWQHTSSPQQKNTVMTFSCMYTASAWELPLLSTKQHTNELWHKKQLVRMSRWRTVWWRPYSVSIPLCDSFSTVPLNQMHKTKF